MQSKSKLLKLHDAIYDLSTAVSVVVIDTELIITHNVCNWKSKFEFATEKDALKILDKCYEIMKG